MVFQTLFSFWAMFKLQETSGVFLVVSANVAVSLNGLWEIRTQKQKFSEFMLTYFSCVALTFLT